MNRRVDAVIIGAGAAGLAAAAGLAGANGPGRGISLCLIEKNEIPGRKILATGGGRCNLTNRACAGSGATLDFFRSLGLEVFMDEQGRYYPYSGCASDVVRVLTEAALGENTVLLTGRQAQRIERRTKGGFRVLAGGEEILCRTVLLAAGGKAAPQFGTTGDGYRLARQLGHRVTRTYPILTGIRCSRLAPLKGIRAKGIVRLFSRGELIGEERGEIQFTGDGLSGICVFNLTPLIRAEEGEEPQEAFRRCELSLDLAPDFTESQVAGRKSSFGIVTAPLAEEVSPRELKDWRLPVEGVKGWRDAQCTAGGVCLEEIDEKTMESKLCPGLFFAGELLNRQGPCGGFNLQNAWETGLAAARGIRARLEGESLEISDQ